MRRRARTARRLGGACFASILLSGGQVSAAAVEVHATGCEDVNEHEVVRLLAIELAFVDSAPPLRDVLRVELLCSGANLKIAIVDPATQKQLEREVALGPPEPGRERTIALLASQLLLTSWAESFLARTAPAPTAPKDPPLSLSRRSVASEASSDEPLPPATSWEVALAAGLRMREWESPVYDPRVVLRPSIGVGRVHLLLDLAYEHGSTPRTGGNVAWSMASGGLGAGWRSERLGVVGLEASVTASVVWIVAEGAPAQPAFVGDARRGVAGEAAIAVGPVVFMGPVRAGLELETGVTLPGVTARVAGDSSVALGGAWAGASLRVGAAKGAW